MSESSCEKSRACKRVPHLSRAGMLVVLATLGCTSQGAGPLPAQPGSAPDQSQPGTQASAQDNLDQPRVVQEQPTAQLAKTPNRNANGDYVLLPQLFGAIGANRRGFGLDHDGSRFLVEEFGELNYWEVESGRRAGNLPWGGSQLSDPSMQLTTGENGRILGVLRRLDDNAKDSYHGFVWDSKSDQLLHRIDIPMANLGSTWTLALSPDGNRMAFGAMNRVVLHDIAGGSLRDVQVWPVKNGRYDVEFVGNASVLVRCYEGYEQNLRGTALIDVSSGEVRWERPVPIAMGHDEQGDLFAVASAGGIELRRSVDGDAHAKVPGTLPVRFTPDGRALLTNSVEHGAALWNTQTGARNCRLEDTLWVGYEGQFSPDSQRLFWDRTGLGIWDVETGRLLREVKNTTKHVVQALFTPDGDRLVLTGNPSVAIELSSMSPLAPAEGAQYRFRGPEGNLFKRMRLQKDGVALAPLRFYMEDKYITKGNHSLILHDGQTDEIVHTFQKQKVGTFGSAWAAHPKKPLFALSSVYEKQVRFYDTKTWKQVGVLELNDVAKWVDFHPDLPLLAVRGRKGHATLYNLDTQEYVTLLLGLDGEWIFYSEDGKFGGSKHAGRMVSVFDGARAYGIEQFGIAWNRPDVLLERMGLGGQDLREHYSKRAERRLSKAGITAADTSGKLSPPTAAITSFVHEGKFASVGFQLAANQTSLSTYQIYVNDVPLFGPEGKRSSGDAFKGRERVELVSGNNKIEVSCRDARGQESLRALEQVLYPETVVGDLYFLGFGASKYADSTLDLQYAHKDAKDLQALFQSLDEDQTAGGFKAVHTRVLTNQEVTKAALEQSADFLADAHVDDTVVLFIAGHGVHTDDQNSSYYYLTHDTDLNDIEGTAAPFSIIESLLHAIAPRRKLFLMDTCESGEIDPDQEASYAAQVGSRGLMARTAQRGIQVLGKPGANSEPRAPRKWLWNRDRFIYNDLLRRSGAIVFSSSRGGEYSYESDAIENGYFTEALLAAFGEGAADENNDAWITSLELQHYVSADVSQQTASAQNPTVDRDNLDVVLRFPRAGAAQRPAWWDEPLRLRPALEAGPGAPPSVIPLASQSLQKLVDETPDGGTLQLECARYESALPIRINKRRDLTILGVPGTTIVNTTNMGLIFAIENSFGIRLQNCSAYHETVKSCVAGVVEVHDCQFIRLQNCELNGCGTVGIDAQNVRNLDVLNCHIHSNTFQGIFFAAGLENVRLFNNHLHDNTQTFAGGVPDGIQAEGNIARGQPWNLGK